MTKDESVLVEAERIIHGERRTDYGGVVESFERIAALWSTTLGVPITAEQVAPCSECSANRGRCGLLICRTQSVR